MFSLGAALCNEYLYRKGRILNLNRVCVAAYTIQALLYIVNKPRRDISIRSGGGAAAAGEW
jgi:hypothetical protein